MSGEVLVLRRPVVHARLRGQGLRLRPGGTGGGLTLLAIADALEAGGVATSRGRSVWIDVEDLGGLVAACDAAEWVLLVSG